MPYQKVDAGALTGTGQTQSATITPTEIKVQRTRRTEADIGTVTGVVTSGDAEEGAQAGISLGGFRVMTGRINSISANEDGTYKYEIYSAVRQLTQATLTKSYTEANPNTVLNDAAIKAGITATFPDVGTTTATITAEFSDEPCINVFERVANAAGWYWYVTRFNRINVIDQFGMTTSEVGGIVDGNPGFPSGAGEFLLHPVKYVLEASPGKLTPPYQRVIVYGANNATDSAGRAHLLAKGPIVAEATSTQFDQNDATFTYRDRMLTSTDMAEEVATKILERFNAQQIGGSVTIAGNPLIRPYDVIEMPNGEDGRPDLGGARYLVQGVTHTITNDEGWKTKIQCGGLIDADDFTTIGGGGTPGVGTGPADPDPGDGDTGDGDTGDGDDGDDGDGGIGIPWPFGPLFPAGFGD